jgi:hypothetical protein
MSTTVDHYANHLAPVYVWMSGGVESAFERGETELVAIGATPAGSRTEPIGSGLLS